MRAIKPRKAHVRSLFNPCPAHCCSSCHHQERENSRPNPHLTTPFVWRPAGWHAAVMSNAPDRYEKFVLPEGVKKWVEKLCTGDEGRCTRLQPRSDA